MTTQKETPAATGVPNEERHNTSMNAVHRLSDVDREQATYLALRLLADDSDRPQILPDDTARTRKSDPEESHLAADRSQKTLTAARRAVLELLTVHSELTGSEINDWYAEFRRTREWPLISWDSPRKRAGELLADGYLEVVGRRNGERVLALTDAGRQAVAK